MKHIFVVNPKAGGTDRSGELRRELERWGSEVEMYITQAARDATRFVAARCQEAQGEELRFYACGGDGTLNEVVSGAMGCATAAVGCYPCGSGNDYVKYYPGSSFAHLGAQLGARPVAVDVMRVVAGEEVRYCLNTLNFGFEAEVCRTMAEVRRKPLVGGRLAYATGIVRSLAKGRHNPCRIVADGREWHHGDLLLASAANGRYAGGGYMCAPRAVNDDGWMELMAIKPLSVARFAKMIGRYEKGEHLDAPELKEDISYCRARKVCLESDEPFYIAIDGEMIEGRRFEVECLHQAVRFLVPEPEGQVAKQSSQYN